jgi:hypothetical protein
MPRPEQRSLPADPPPTSPAAVRSQGCAASFCMHVHASPVFLKRKRDAIIRRDEDKEIGALYCT